MLIPNKREQGGGESLPFFLACLRGSPVCEAEGLIYRDWQTETPVRVPLNLFLVDKVGAI